MKMSYTRTEKDFSFNIGGGKGIGLWTFFALMYMLASNSVQPISYWSFSGEWQLDHSNFLPGV